MKTSLIKIRTAFGVSETQLSDKSVEIKGPKGAGKSSVLDAIRYALTNRSDRAYIVKQGADEAEIIIETDTGLRIDRKIKAGMETGSLSLKENGMNVPRPQTFLDDIFTPLQLNPVEFIQKPIAEQNRIILSLIKYDWNMETISTWFGEIPKGVDYHADILSVLQQIQADNGVYYQTRQQINSDKLHKKKTIEDIGASIPDGYKVETWEDYDSAAKYTELEKIRRDNANIEKSKAYKASYDDKLRGITADRDIAISAAKDAIVNEREGLLKTIERLKAEIIAAENQITGLNAKQADKEKIAQSEFEAAKATLDSNIGVASQYADKAITDTSVLQAELENAERMKRFMNEYYRMIRTQKEVDDLQIQSDELTRKIDLARKLPGQVLADAVIPVQGLTVVGGVPLVNGLPLSNLSSGERLNLCIDITVSKPNGWQIILIDGVECLDTKSRDELYAKCKAKGLQFIAAKTTDDNELIITEL
jgi:energy-coupling factor transporter ATP-binding protein EcfA2